MISSLEVIWIFDTEIRPNKDKMVVCICPDERLFYRINSYDDFPIGVFIEREPDHLFLKWDSFIECGKYPLDLDDHTIEKALAQNGGNAIGQIASKHAADICKAVQLQKTISPEVRNLIFKALGFG